MLLSSPLSPLCHMDVRSGQSGGPFAPATSCQTLMIKAGDRPAIGVFPPGLQAQKECVRPDCDLPFSIKNFRSILNSGWARMPAS